VAKSCRENHSEKSNLGDHPRVCAQSSEPGHSVLMKLGYQILILHIDWEGDISLGITCHVLPGPIEAHSRSENGHELESPTS